MQTKIGEKLYITKFFYGKAKNPNSRGLWRNRKTECAIFEIVSPAIEKKVGFLGKLFGSVSTRTPAVLKEVCRATTQNRHGEAYIKAVGRRMAFLKAIENDAVKEHRRIFLDSFDEQCGSSADNKVRLYVQDLLESVRESR